jgi:hypothetical protein
MASKIANAGWVADVVAIVRPAARVVVTAASTWAVLNDRLWLAAFLLLFFVVVGESAFRFLARE